MTVPYEKIATYADALDQVERQRREDGGLYAVNCGAGEALRTGNFDEALEYARANDGMVHDTVAGTRWSDERGGWVR